MPVDPSHHRQGLVCAPQPEAAYEGAKVLEAGGNAADALVTAALVQGVIDSHRCGLGGFGCSTLYFRGPNGATALAVDFHGRAGSRARPDSWEDIFEGATPDGFGYLVRGKVNDVGYLAITVPGVAAGLGEIHSRFGRLAWRGLCERAIPYAEQGFAVSQELAEFWIRPGLYGRVSTRERLGFTAEGRRICFKENGETYRAGEVFRQPEIAETYRRLAREGAESFYRGDIGREIARDWEAHGALVDQQDLAGYRPQVRRPVSGTFRGLEVLSSPLPAGGVALLQVLKLAESIDLARHGHNTPRYIHELGRILQAVWRDRLDHQGDPGFGTPPEHTFLDPSYIERLLEDGRMNAPTAPESEDTTQLTILDADGNAVSFSHSLGYNSGVFAPKLGVLFNNCMSAFDPIPGRRNSIAPGKARSTAVAETIVLRDGEPFLVLGSPGAARITAGIAQVILNVVEFGMNVAEAVSQPRFDAFGPGRMVLESRFPRPLVREIEDRGWNVQLSPKPFGVVGRVYAAECDYTPASAVPHGLGRPPRSFSAGVDPGAPGAAYRAGAQERST
jgi:gamma-glutamyltranspeptidase/glutathione hydrolase